MIIRCNFHVLKFWRSQCNLLSGDSSPCRLRELVRRFRLGLFVILICVLLAHPAAAQFDIVGYWNQPAQGSVMGPGIAAIFGFEEDSTERADGPPLADYRIPLNDEARARALSYDGSLLPVPEHECMPHPATYSFWDLAQLSIIEEVDDNLNLVAYHVGGTFRRADRTIWMDGRPQPPDYAPHTWAGFTTGKWEGNTLVTTTTHIKWAWIRRNGVPSSDEGTVTTFYNRLGNVLTIAWMVHDPVYLTESYVKSADFIQAVRIPTAQFGDPPAGQANGTFFKCFPGEEVVRADPHAVPHYLPWANPFTEEFANKLHIPKEAAMGGAETAYPEYQDRLRPGK
jgi:hypothetical protein